MQNDLLLSNEDQASQLIQQLTDLGFAKQTGSGRWEVNLSRETTREDFERWWKLYPSKRGKKPAWNAWKRIKPDVDMLCEDTAIRTRSDSRWLNGYIPNPTTYLNQERWNDEFTTQRQHNTTPADRNQQAAAEYFGADDWAHMAASF